MRFKIFAAASLEEVQNIFSDSAASENAEEHFKSQRGWIGQSEREKGTLQASTFTFKAKRSLEGKKIFMVVTRQDYAWSEVSALKENYAIAIRYADRFLATADLHTQLQAQLNLRTQVQPRVRVQ